MKKVAFIFVLVFFVISFAQIASANTSKNEFGKEIDLVFENKSFNFVNGNLRDVNGTLMVPLREFTSYIEVTLKKTSTNTFAAIKHDTSIEFTIGSKIAKVNKKNVTLPLAPTIVDSVTYMPLTFLTDAFEYKVTYNRYIGEAVVVNNISKIKPLMLTSPDYEIKYYDDDFYKEELDSLGYYYGLIIYEDYYKTKYPNAVYYKGFKLKGNERENGINMEDIYRDQYYSSLYKRSETLGFTKDWDPIERYYLWDSADENIGNTKITDQHIDHYIAFYDSNYKFIDLLLIPIKVPKEKLQTGFTFSNPDYNSYSPLQTAPTVLDKFSISSLPNLKWDYVSNDYFPNYITYRNNVTLTNNYTSSTFNSDKNHYITTLSREDWDKLNKQTIKFDFLEGIEVNFSVHITSPDYRFSTRENYPRTISIYYDEKAIVGKEYKLNFDPFTATRMEINVEIYNPETYITNKYQFIIDKNHSTADLFYLTEDSFNLNEPLLPNDIVSITIPASLTSNKKPIYINFKYGTNPKTLYEFKNYTNAKVILDKPNQTSNIKIRVKRGERYLYDTIYKYDTHLLPVIDGSKYKITYNQYDQEWLVKNRFEGGYVALYAGIADLSAIPKAKYAKETDDFVRSSGRQPSYTDYLRLDEKFPINNVLYIYGYASPRLEYFRYRVNDVYFVLYDEEKFPVAFLKAKITLKEGYVHKILTFLD